MGKEKTMEMTSSALSLVLDKVVCKELIVSTLKRRGKGTEDSILRIITEVYEKDGTLIAENDPCPDIKFEEVDLISFAIWVNQNGYDRSKLDSKVVAKWMDIK